MTSYFVRYEIDIDADSPLEAALKAEKYLNPNNFYRPAFDVIDEDGETTRIDLEEQDAEPESDDIEDDPDNTETRIKVNQPAPKNAVYTVVLLYPGSTTETYTESTEAESVEAAINTVKEIAEAANNGDYTADEFTTIAVFEGGLTPAY